MQDLRRRAAELVAEQDDRARADRKMRWQCVAVALVALAAGAAIGLALPYQLHLYEDPPDRPPPRNIRH